MINGMKPATNCGFLRIEISVEPEPKAMARSAFVILMVAQLPCFLESGCQFGFENRVHTQKTILIYQGICVSNHWIQIQPNNQS